MYAQPSLPSPAQYLPRCLRPLFVGGVLFLRVFPQRVPWHNQTDLFNRKASGHEPIWSRNKDWPLLKQAQIKQIENDTPLLEMASAPSLAVFEKTKIHRLASYISIPIAQVDELSLCSTRIISL